MTLHSLIITKIYFTLSVALLASFTGNVRVMLVLNMFATES
jgi:hypothetical protein